MNGYSHCPVRPLFRILNNMDALQILHIHGGYFHPKGQHQFFSALCGRFHHSLRRFSSATTDTRFDHQIYDGPQALLPLNILSNLCLDANIGKFTPMLSSWYFPALVHLQLRHVMRTNIAGVMAFLKTHGNQLLALNLQEDHVTSTNKLMIEPILALTPNLNSLSLDGPMMELGRRPATIMRRVTHLGLFIDDWPIKPAVGAFECIKDGQFPSLLVVRLQSAASCVKNVEEWHRAIDICSENNIRLENVWRRAIEIGNLKGVPLDERFVGVWFNDALME